MGRGSSYVIQIVNFITLLLSLAILGFGVYLALSHGECQKFLKIPVLVFGSFIFLISIIGYFGSLKDILLLLWIYLIVLTLLILLVAGFTLFLFFVTKTGGGQTVAGQGYKEYRLEDYHKLLRKVLEYRQGWDSIKGCLVGSKNCESIIAEYDARNAYKNVDLSPIQSGCCLPSSACGFIAINATFFNTTSKVTSQDADCKIYQNAEDAKCYECDSCKAGVAEYIRKNWHYVAFFDIGVFVILILILVAGCFAKRNALEDDDDYEEKWNTRR